MAMNSHKSGFSPSAVIFYAFFTFAAMAPAGTYSGGAGTIGKPYKIQGVSDWQELTNTPADWDKQFILTGGFGFGGTTITPVGNETTPFTGVMVGDGHAISGFKINQPDSDYVGLFGYIGSTGYIENLGVMSANIKGRNYVGGLVGKNSGMIRFCRTGNTISGTDYVGGMVGQNYTGTITGCYAINNTMTGNGNCAGGLVGENYYGTITSSYAAVHVAWNGSFAGGLVGKNDSGTITACYSIGRVSGSDFVGGFCGFNTGTVSGCFWDTQISGQTTSDGGTGKTTAEMKTMDTFTAEGWVFSTTEASPTAWILLRNRFPQLSWQNFYSSGTGMEFDPFEIWTVDDWQVLMVDSFHWNCHFTLMTDLDFGGAVITPVAPDTDPESWFDGIPFTGVFDGNGHTLDNFKIDEPTSDYVGLFGFVYGGLVKNLGVVNASIQGQHIVGGLAGANRGTITSCYATGTVTGSGYVGGFVGYNDSEGTITSCLARGAVTGGSNIYFGGLVGGNYGLITSCSATGTVMGGVDSNCVGGLAGNNDGGRILSCYATGAVSGNWEVGGLIGECNGEIVSCYAKGIVSGNGCVGGFAGLNQGGKITSCYSVGKVSGTSYAGGLCGVDTSVISNSFWDTQTSGQTTSSGGTGKTTAEMKMLTTFTLDGWDFTHEWIMPCEDYPHLLWEKTTYSGGSGTATDPYRIGCVADWQFLTTRPEDWSKQFIVTADLDFGGVAIMPVAADHFRLNYFFDGTSFTGVMNGSGHVLSNFKIDQPDSDYVGLFGSVEGGQVSNLGIENAYIRGYDYVGGLVGSLWYGMINSCYAKGTLIGHDSVGGLVGYNCYFSTITSCFSTVTVTGNINVGGLVGSNITSTVVTCYATGTVTGDNPLYVGGLVGWFNGDAVRDCFWDFLSSWQTTSAGGTGKTTTQMKTLSTFTSAGWDFVGEPVNGTADVWRMCGESPDYPRLSWEFSRGGDMNCPDGVGMEDLLYLAERWMAGTLEMAGAADVDGNGKVDLGDFQILASNWMRE